MKVSLVQKDILWENSVGNYAEVLNHVLQAKTDLLVFPEMIFTGFSMNCEALAWEKNDQRLDELHEIGKQKSMAIVFSAMVKAEGKYYNRLYWLLPDGQRLGYNKKHLFSFAGEDKYYTAGNEQLIVEYMGFRIASFICYDLRFPVWNRNIGKYDVALYVANWPAKRREAWNTLLKARAIENQSIVLACNRIGQDGNGLHYSGDSKIIDALGEIKKELQQGEADVLSIELNRAQLETHRRQFPFLKDADQFKITR